jgi:hypothetical protein
VSISWDPKLLIPINYLYNWWSWPKPAWLCCLFLGWQTIPLIWRHTTRLRHCYIWASVSSETFRSDVIPYFLIWDIPYWMGISGAQKYRGDSKGPKGNMKKEGAKQTISFLSPRNCSKEWLILSKNFLFGRAYVCARRPTKSCCSHELWSALSTLPLLTAQSHHSYHLCPESWSNES